MDKSMFMIGDSICYFTGSDKKQEPFQGMVLEIKDRIKISYIEGLEPKIVWVAPERIEKRDTSRCAHNAECGWCDDTGKCIYES